MLQLSLFLLLWLTLLVLVAQKQQLRQQALNSDSWNTIFVRT